MTLSFTAVSQSCCPWELCESLTIQDFQQSVFPGRLCWLSPCRTNHVRRNRKYLAAILASKPYAGGAGQHGPAAPWPNGPAAPDLPPLRGIQFRAKARDAVKKASGPDGWHGDEIMHLPEGLLQLFANFFNQLESGSQSWPTALLQWRQVCIPKPSGTGLRPLSIGSVWYRMWSSIRIKQLSQWIVDRVGPHFHGGVKQRGTVSALLKPLCLLQKTQNDDSQPGRHRRLAARRRLLRWIGAADLSKAFDRLHGALAGPALKRMGLPAALVDAWTAAWIHQMRFLQFGSQTSKGAVRNISCLPQGDPCSPLALLGVLAEALWRLQKKHPERTHGPTVWRIYIDDRSWFCARMKTCLIA